MGLYGLRVAGARQDRTGVYSTVFRDFVAVGFT